jgi:hypothetical protein
MFRSFRSTVKLTNEGTNINDTMMCLIYIDEDICRRKNFPSSQREKMTVFNSLENSINEEQNKRKEKYELRIIT